MIYRPFVFIALVCFCITTQSCTSILKCVADRKFPPKYEATIKTESVRQNFCNLQALDQADLELSLNTSEINQALQANLPKMRAQVRKMKPFSPVKKLTIDSIQINALSCYSQEQFVGIKADATIFFPAKSIVKSVAIQLNGGMTVSSRQNTISLNPMLSSLKVTNVQSKCFLISLPFIRNFANKCIATVKDNINGAIPPVKFVVNIPVFQDKKFSSFLPKVSGLVVKTDADLSIDYHFLPPAIIMDSNNLKIMTQIIDDSYVATPRPCVATNISNVQGMNAIILSNRPPVFGGINTQPVYQKILTTQYQTNYKPRKNSNEGDSIQKFLQMFAYYKVLFDDVRLQYLTPDLTNERTVSIGNLSKNLIQRATTKVFTEASAMRLQFDFAKTVDIINYDLTLGKFKVNCDLINTSCNKTFNCTRLQCNQDCKWSKPWNCVAKAACLTASFVEYNACQAANKTICLGKAAVQFTYCGTLKLGDFLLDKFLTVGDINGNLNFSGNATFGLEKFDMAPDLSNVSINILYNASGDFNAKVNLSAFDKGGLGYILCPLPTLPIIDAEHITSSSPAYNVQASIQTDVVNDTTVLNIASSEAPITINTDDKPALNFMANNAFPLSISCPLILPLAVVGGGALSIFGNDNIKSYIKALFTGHYTQKLPGIKYQLKIKPIEVKTDFRDYTTRATWTPKSIQFTLK